MARVRRALSIAGGALVLHDDGQLWRYLRGDVVDRERSASDAVASMGPGSIAAIANDGGRTIVASRDGAIATLDPQSFALAPIASIGGEPQWIHAGSQQVVVVTSDDVSIVARDTRRVRALDVAVHGASAFAVVDDSLWAASSTLQRIDLLGASTTTIATELEPIAGILARIRRGELDANGFRARLPAHVRAYGGNRFAFIVDVDGAVWRGDAGRIGPLRALTPNGTEFIAMVGDALYTVDAAFATWSAMATLPADAVADAAAGWFTSSSGKIMFAATRGLFVLNGERDSYRIEPLGTIRQAW
jgi:hypothetical protein